MGLSQQATNTELVFAWPVWMSVRYAELHALSNFTFLRGASHPEELVETAAALGYEALAITDECSMSGIVRAHAAAKDAGLKKLIIGSELRLASGRKLVVLAQNIDGYAALCQLISNARRAAKRATTHSRDSILRTGCPIAWCYGFQTRT